MIKCVVWDLDDTLWQGILAEGDRLHLPKEIGELLERMDQAGILQSIASRNQPHEAAEQMQRFGIASYFLFPQFQMVSKAAAIEKIVDELHIGLDTIAFLDDSDFELGEVAFFLPQVQCFHRERGWDAFCAAIETEITAAEREATYESRNRRKFFQIEAKKDQARLDFKGSREAFLESCGMTLTMDRGREEDLPRVIELLRRTNQFKTFAQNADEAACRTYLLDPEGHKTLLTAKLSDKFGNYGIVGICFCTEHIIEQFCISCRVGGRGVAAAFMEGVLQFLRSKYPDRNPECRFCTSDRNLPMLILLQSMGFRKLSSDQETEKRVDAHGSLVTTCHYVCREHISKAPSWIQLVWLSH
jgi:FkbH-like protein